MQKAQIFRAERHECLIQQLHCFFFLFFQISLSDLYSNPIHPLISTSPPSGTLHLISGLVLRTGCIILPLHLAQFFFHFVMRPFQSSFPSNSIIRISTSDGTRLSLSMLAELALACSLAPGALLTVYVNIPSARQGAARLGAKSNQAANQIGTSRSK